jgi:hypothetical protein
VLRDAARFARRHIRRADAVEQRGLAVIDVSHDRDDGSARHFHVVRARLDQLFELFFNLHLFERHERHFVAETLSEVNRHFVVERLVDRGEDAALQQQRHDVFRLDAELFGKLFDG